MQLKVLRPARRNSSKVYRDERILLKKVNSVQIKIWNFFLYLHVTKINWVYTILFASNNFRHCTLKSELIRCKIQCEHECALIST